MSSIKSFGQLPYLNFKRLCCKNKNIIDENCKLTLKNGTIRNLNVPNELIMDGVLKGNDKLTVSGGTSGEVLINGSIFTGEDEHSRISYIDGNIGNITITPIEGYFDPTTVTITHNPCDGNIVLDPLSGNVFYEPLGDTPGQIDSYQYNITDECGLGHQITQYICRPASDIPPFLNGNCINEYYEFQQSLYDLSMDLVPNVVMGDLPVDGNSFVITNIEELNPSLLTELDLISFAGWTTDQVVPTSYPLMSANYIISPGAYAATQNMNNQDTGFLVGTDLDLCDWNVRVSTRALGTIDDDYIGFVVGYNAGDHINSNANYLRFYWAGPNGSTDGTFVVHQVGAVVPNEITNPFIELSRGLAFGSTPWVLNITYVWRLEYVGGRIKVYINDTLDFDFAWTFPNGANVGLFTLSQPCLFNNGFRWSNVSCPCSALRPDWISATGNVSANITGGVLTTSSSSLQKGVRVSATVSDTLAQVSNEAQNYFGFLCQNYLTFIETITVPSTTGTPTLTSFTSEINKRYAFVVKGTVEYDIGLPRRVDALYQNINYPNPLTWNGPAPFFQIDNTATWMTDGNVNLDHIYLDIRNGTGSPFGVKFADNNYPDNRGSFTVDIYEVCALLEPIARVSMALTGTLEFDHDIFFEFKNKTGSGETPITSNEPITIEVEMDGVLLETITGTLNSNFSSFTTTQTTANRSLLDHIIVDALVVDGGTVNVRTASFSAYNGAIDPQAGESDITLTIYVGQGSNESNNLDNNITECANILLIASSWVGIGSPTFTVSYIGSGLRAAYGTASIPMYNSYNVTYVNGLTAVVTTTGTNSNQRLWPLYNINSNTWLSGMAKYGTGNASASGTNSLSKWNAYGEGAIGIFTFDRPLSKLSMYHADVDWSSLGNAGGVHSITPEGNAWFVSGSSQTVISNANGIVEYRPTTTNNTLYVFWEDPLTTISSGDQEQDAVAQGAICVYCNIPAAANPAP